MQPDTKLTKKQIEAAGLMFEDRLTEHEIAEKLGVDERTIRRWRLIPELLEEIAELRRHFLNTTRSHFLATKLYRLRCKMDRHRALTRIITNRAACADPAVPGADTGLLMKRTRVTKDGEITEYRVDTTICRELSKLEAEIEKHLGQEEEQIMTEDYRQRQHDFSSLTDEDKALLEKCQEKICLDNPWIGSPYQHPFPEHEIERIEKAIAARAAKLAPKKGSGLYLNEYRHGNFK